LSAGDALRDCGIYEGGNADKNEKRDAAHVEILRMSDFTTDCSPRRYENKRVSLCKPNYRSRRFPFSINTTLSVKQLLRKYLECRSRVPLIVKIYH